MKRLISLLVILAVSLQAMAKPVSESTAKSLAEKFLQRPSEARLALKGKMPAKTVGKNGVAIKTSVAATPAYYVFNFDGGGFVIVSGEDEVEPILGYSKTGSFTLEGAPANIRWWLDGRASEIGMIRSGSAKALPAKRKAPGARTYGTIEVQYETAKWNQYAPYNNECPMIGSNRAVTGCVATAGAIVARYFQWPDAGVGSTQEYTYVCEDLCTIDNQGNITKEVTKTIPSVALGRSYDWANMPLTYRSNYTTAQANAVAALMVDIGKASQMSYNYNYGSGTFDNDLLLAFQKNFKYNKRGYQAYRDGYTDAEWIQKLKDNLRNVGPMVYGGADDDGGHEFVFDGYTEDNYFSVNWGWGGEDNGWFLVDGLTITSQNWTFSQQQSTLFDLSPDRNGTTTYIDNIGLSEYGFYSFPNSFSTGTSFNISLYWVFNNATTAFNGKIWVAVYDKNDNLKEKVSAAKSISNLANPLIAYQLSGDESDYENAYLSYDSWSCKITGAIKGGDRLRVHYEGQYSSGYARGDGKDCLWEIVLAENTGSSAEEIAAATSLSWDKVNRKLTTSTSLAEGISLIIKKADGTSMYSIASMAKDRAYEINCSSYAPGTYTLVYGGGEDYTLSFTL